MTTLPLRMFSFGGGVQSNAVLVLTVQGVLRYDYFVFANVGEDSERSETLRYIRDVARPYAEQHGIALVEVSKTKRTGATVTLYEHLIGNNRTIGLPMRLSNGAPGNRACTSEWKIRVIARWLKKHGATLDRPAITGLGISVDESHRARTDSGIPWQVLEYPLLDLRLTRADCRRIIQEAGLPVPPKSACWFCPFQRTREWEDLRRTEPILFQRACDLETRLNEKRKAIGKDIVRFHRSLKPLAEAVHEGQTSWEDDYEMCESGYCMT